MPARDQIPHYSRQDFFCRQCQPLSVVEDCEVCREIGFVADGLVRANYEVAVLTDLFDDSIEDCSPLIATVMLPGQAVDDRGSAKARGIARQNDASACTKFAGDLERQQVCPPRRRADQSRNLSAMKTGSNAICDGGCVLPREARDLQALCIDTSSSQSRDHLI